MWYASGDNDDKHPHFVYDGLSRRVRIEYGNVTLDQNDDFDYFTAVTTKEYAFLGTQPIVEYDYNSQQQTRDVARQYYWGLDIVAGIGGLLYQKVPGGTAAYYYYHYDGIGNVTAITDGSKDVKALYEYDAFGNLISKCGELANDFTFSTQFAYGASGWSMYMYRNYSPRLGRWTQRDPIGLADGHNLYVFCGNNPLNLIDKFGLLSRDESTKIAAVFVAVAVVSAVALLVVPGGWFGTVALLKALSGVTAVYGAAFGLAAAFTPEPKAKVCPLRKPDVGQEVWRPGDDYYFTCIGYDEDGEPVWECTAGEPPWAENAVPLRGTSGDYPPSRIVVADPEKLVVRKGPSDDTPEGEDDE